MPEVGVLSLAIKTNAEEATSGLDKLVGALTRVKNAVSGNLGLNGYADGLKRLGKIVDENIHGSTIVKLSQLADSLKKLKDAGGSISSLAKIAKVTEGYTTASEQVETLKESVNEVRKSVAAGINIPIRAAIQDNLKNVYVNEKGYLMGNTEKTAELTDKYYKSLPERTFEDFFEGYRYKRDMETGHDVRYQQKDLMSQWLQGNGTEKEQLYAIQQMSAQFNMTVDEVRERLAALRGETDAVTSGVQGMKDQTADLTDKTEKASWSIQDLKEKIGTLKHAASQNIFSKLLNSFARLVKYRVLRYVIRSITSGFREGVENVYNYSKAISGSLAPALDSTVSILAQMKNSLGAAVAPLLQAVIPVLNQLVAGFINIINYANQFISLLNGQATWTRALPQTEKAFEKQKKAAKGAGAAIKDLLADWDELNIIQSESTGAGGATDVAADYKNMFEEVNSFDEDVNNILSFINDHLGGLPEILKKAGIALLGWKFSKAFTGLLGTLGKLVAGGVLIDVGLDLAYGAAYDAGSKGYFDTHDIIRSIIGGLATALGGSLITTALGLGGVLGFGIGLTAAAVITIVGYCNGERDLNDKNKWGNLSWTQDQIEKFVREQFTFPVDAEIDVFDAHLKSETEAKRQVDEAISNFNNSLKDAEHIVADIDTSTQQQKVEAVKKAAEDAQAAIKALQNLIDLNEEGITYTLTSFTFKDAEGNDITEDLLNSIQVSDTTLREYFSNVGQDLAKLMLEGEKSGWKNGEMDAALELMASQKRIYDRAAELKDKMTFETQTTAALDSAKEKAKNGLLDRDTATGIFEEQKQKLDEYKDTVEAAVKKEADNLTYLAALAESAAIEAGYNPETGLGSEAALKLHAASEEYMSSATAILSDIDKAVEDRLKETKEKMRSEWAELLSVVYGDDFEKISQELGNNGVFELGDWDWLTDPFGDNYSWESINKHGITETANRLYELLLGEMTAWNNDYNGLVGYYTKDLGGNLFDLLTDGAKKAIAQKLLTYSDDTSNAYEIFKAMFHLDDETAKKYIDAPEYQDIWKSTLEDQPPIEADVPFEITPVVDMDALKNEIETLIEDGMLDFDEIQYLVEKYQSDKALDDAFKEMNITLDDEGYLTGNLTKRAARFIASAGSVSDVGWMQNNPITPTAPEQQMTEVDFARAVETGATNANDGVVNAIQALGDYIVRELQKQANRPVNVNLYPNSAWGAHNASSAAEYSRVTGV